MAPPNKISKRQNNLTTQTLLDFDLEESSSDSDFRIEDHDDDSDDYSVNSKDNKDEGEEEEEDESDSSESESDEKSTQFYEKINTTEHILNLAYNKENEKFKLISHPICCACLGERSDDTNEIVECDGCGVSVHEGCYGVSDSGSVSSTVSSCSTEPWFCEACKAGITNPICELCPNKGGIFKETDVGKWVHLVCALYVPGVAFGEVDQLSSVTLFEMPYSKWGAKTCSLCEDSMFARTGVCIGCDAGMCKNYFHVTCAQSNGLLSEAHSEEVDHADPFYAHCKIHSDKTLVKNRKRNFNALKLKMEHRYQEQERRKFEKPSTEQQRIERKLKKHKNKYFSNKTIKTEPWVPTQKMPRLLTTSASACRQLVYKAELMGIDTNALEFQETQIAALLDVRKKWHIPPAFSVEFIGYYLDRIVRLKDIKTNLKTQFELNKNLLSEQQILRDKYDEKIKINQDLSRMNMSLKQTILKLHTNIQVLCPNKQLETVDNIGRSPAVLKAQNLVIQARPMSVPTAAALKMGVGFPLNNLHGTMNDTGRVLSTQRQGNEALLHECGICKKCTDQHLLAKCDTCHFYYHLGCLSPPLLRHPKKSKLYGWQCSECDKSDESEPDLTLAKAQRRSRVRYSKDGVIIQSEEDFKDDNTIINRKVNGNEQQNFTTKTDSDTTVILDDQSSPIKDEVDAIAQSSTPSTDANISHTNSRSEKKIKKSLTKNFRENLNKPLIENQANIIDPLDLSVSDVNKDTQIFNDSRAIQTNDDNSVKIKMSKKSKKTKKNQFIGEPSYFIANINQSQRSQTNVLINSAVDNQNYSSNSYESSSYLPQFTSEIITEDNLVGVTNEFNYRQNRKRKKDKHKRYSSDSEKMTSKEHKKKHKRKNHDIESGTKMIAFTGDGPHPRIKIKFKAIHFPTGEDSAQSKMIYVPSVSENTQPKPMEIITDVENTSENMDIEPSIITPTPAENSRHSKIMSKTKNLNIINKPNNSVPVTVLICDVCQVTGTPQNLVNCDECKKNYHFHCLEPPVKKTPKRRGYSWHCADCDPTENESN